MHPHLHPFLFLALFSVGLVAAIFDTLVGGGGLITIPAILMTGLPLYLALGTNKLQASFGSGSATLRFCMKERKSIQRIWIGILFTTLGAIMGVFTLFKLNPHALMKAIPIILLIVLLYAIFSKRLRNDEDRPTHIPYFIFMILAGLVMGFYDAFLGAGTGVFWAALLVIGLGFSIRKATIYTKALNFTSNIVSLLVFILMHQVIYSVGLTMALGQFAGGQIGAQLILKKGSRLIRPIYISVVSILLITLSYKTYFLGHI